jgi:hypothetical protein
MKFSRRIWPTLFVLLALSAYVSCSTTNYRTVAQVDIADFQGPDYPVESWRCGAPLVKTLQTDKTDDLIEDGEENFLLKKSLLTISHKNYEKLIREVGPLNPMEQTLFDTVVKKWLPPIIHRTSVEVMAIILPKKLPLASAAKRKVPATATPGVEDKLFSGYDCVFTSVVPPFGIVSYGTVKIKLKENHKFAWGSTYTGWTWMKNRYGAEPDIVSSLAVSDKDRRDYSSMVFTNEIWPEVVALQVIKNIRAQTSVRGGTVNFDAKTILADINKQTSFDNFWTKINYYRIAYLEGKYADNLTVDDIEYIEFRAADKVIVESWSLPPEFFLNKKDGPFIRFFDRTN